MKLSIALMLLLVAVASAQHGNRVARPLSHTGLTGGHASRPAIRSQSVGSFGHSSGSRVVSTGSMGHRVVRSPQNHFTRGHTGLSRASGVSHTQSLGGVSRAQPVAGHVGAPRISTMHSSQSGHRVVRSPQHLGTLGHLRPVAASAPGHLRSVSAPAPGHLRSVSAPAPGHLRSISAPVAPAPVRSAHGLSLGAQHSPIANQHSGLISRHHG